MEKTPLLLNITWADMVAVLNEIIWKYIQMQQVYSSNQNQCSQPGQVP